MQASAYALQPLLLASLGLVFKSLVLAVSVGQIVAVFMVSVFLRLLVVCTLTSAAGSRIRRPSAPRHDQGMATLIPCVRRHEHWPMTCGNTTLAVMFPHVVGQCSCLGTQGIMTPGSAGERAGKSQPATAEIVHRKKGL